MYTVYILLEPKKAPQNSNVSGFPIWIIFPKVFFVFDYLCTTYLGIFAKKLSKGSCWGVDFLL